MTGKPITKRAKQPLTPAEIADIRNSNDSVRTIARIHSISMAYVYMLQRGNWTRIRATA